MIVVVFAGPVSPHQAAPCERTARPGGSFHVLGGRGMPPTWEKTRLLLFVVAPTQVAAQGSEPLGWVLGKAFVLPWGAEPSLEEAE